MKNRIVIYSTIVIACCALWISLIYAPAKARRAVVELEIHEAREKLADYHQTLSELPAYIKSLDSLTQEKEHLLSNLYSKAEILKLIEKVNEQASSNDLVVVEVSPPVAELLRISRMSRDSELPEILNLTLRLEGQYQNFGKFLDQIERTPFFRGINRVRIDAQYETPDHLGFVLDFKALLGQSESAR